MVAYPLLNAKPKSPDHSFAIYDIVPYYLLEANMKFFIFLIVAMMMANLPVILGQMEFYNGQYDAQQAAYCQNGYGSARDCGFGTRNQNWFGTYQLGKANPYGFVSTMPYGYGSGAQPFFSDPYAGGWPGTSFGPGGYQASALPSNNNNPYYNGYNNMRF